MKRPIIVRILFFFLFTTKIIASYDAPMTSIGNSAAMIGIGNIEGFDHSAAVLFQNPASLSGVYNTSISTFYTTFIENDVTFLSASIATRLPIGVIAAGASGTEITGLSHTVLDDDDRIVESSDFSFKDMTYKLGYQTDLSLSSSLGIAGTYRSQDSFQFKGTGYNLDAGLILIFDQCDLSIAAKNILGTSMTYKTPTETIDVKMDPVYQIGIRASLPVFEGLDLYGQYKMIPDQSQNLMAVALRYPLPIFPAISISGAWQEFLVLKQKKNKTAIGLILNADTLIFNFAFEKSDYPGQDNQYYFSMDLNI